MKSVKSIIVISSIVVSSIFVFAPSTNTVTHEVTVRGGSTINQMVLDAAKAEGINLDSVDLNESRDITIHESGVDAGNLKPGATITVKVVYRK